MTDRRIIFSKKWGFIPMINLSSSNSKPSETIHHQIQTDETLSMGYEAKATIKESMIFT